MNESKVAESYSAVARKERDAGDQEHRSPYRHFNNFVKKDLVAKALKIGAEGTKVADLSHPPKFKVLDLACGRGGDAGKWLWANRMGRPTGLPVVESLVGIDIAPDAIEEATRRGGELQQASKVPIGTSVYQVGNVFDPETYGKDIVQKAVPFDVISVQFALHYGCASTESLGSFFRSTASVLRPGGVVIGTTVDCAELTKRFRKAWADQQEHPTQQKDGDEKETTSDKIVVKNSLFCMKSKRDVVGPALDECSSSSQGADTEMNIGVNYDFRLEDLVDCDEFSIPVKDLVAEAEKAGLKPAGPQWGLNSNFSVYLPSWERDGNKVKNLGANATLSQDERELVTLYRTFAFIKV